MPSIREQLRRHSVALVSLAVALTSLGYNTWRNEQTEANRNVRTAGIEYLLKLGELEQTVLFIVYDMDANRGNPREGWAYILTIKDLAALTEEPAITSTQTLFEVWQADWSHLEEGEDAARRLSNAIDQARADMLSVLANLD